MVLAGRGFGKTRTGAEWVRDQVESGRCKRIALVAATAADARDVMVEGESGILACCPPWNKPLYEPSKRRVTWPSGAIATLYSAEEPQRLRGPQHDGAWADELAAWRDPIAWDMLMFGLRLGADPKALATTTPRPLPILTDLLALPTTIKTGGSTYANRVHLAPGFFSDIITKYEGTRLGRQELLAEMLDAGGRFFGTWSERVHVCPHRVIPSHWKWFGAVDWGKAAPFVFLLFAVSEIGRVYVVAEVCEANLENWEQAEKINACLRKHNLTPAQCLITADPSMFPPKDEDKRKNHYDIDEYRKAGLIAMPADNDRISGWSRVKEFLNTFDMGDFGEDELVPMVQVFPGCSELIKSLPVLLEDEKSVEDVAKRPKQYDHPADTLRYGLKTRNSPAKKLLEAGPPDWEIDENGDIVEVNRNVSIPIPLQSPKRKEILL